MKTKSEIHKEIEDFASMSPTPETYTALSKLYAELALCAQPSDWFSESDACLSKRVPPELELGDDADDDVKREIERCYFIYSRKYGVWIQMQAKPRVAAITSTSIQDKNHSSSVALTASVGATELEFYTMSETLDASFPTLAAAAAWLWDNFGQYNYNQ